MRQLSSFKLRCMLSLLVAGIALPFVLYGAWRCAQTMYTLPSRWLPETFDVQQSLRYFIDEFESGDFIVVSWSGCNLDDARLTALEDAFAALMEDPDRVSDARLFDRLQTGRTAVETLRGPPLDLRRQAAIERLQGILVGPDGKSSCAVFALTERGTYERGPAIKLVEEMAEQACGLSRDELHLAGPPVDGLVLDREGHYAATVLRVPSVLISCALGWICLRSWPFTLAVVGIGVYAESLIMAIMYWCGVNMSAVLIIMAPLVFVLTVSAGVHLVNYFYEAMRNHDGAEAARRAVSTGWFPCALATATTAIGLGSLMVSDITPIVRFAQFAPVGVVCGVVLLFLVLPGVLEYVGSSRYSHAIEGLVAKRFGDTFVRWVCRHSMIIVLVFGAIMVVAGYGLLHMRTSVAFDSLFDPDARIVQDYEWLEQNIGSMVPVEIIAHFDVDSEFRMVDELAFVQELEQVVGRLEHVGGTMSTATFAPNVPLGPGVRNAARRSVIDDWLEKSRSDLDASGFYTDQPQRRSWRISARIPATAGVNYQEFLDRVERQVTPIVQAFEKQNSCRLSIDYTGVMPMVSRVQTMLLDDLIEAFLTAFIIIAVIMVVALRSVVIGLVAMIPNLFPVVVVFGVLGWADFPIDIGVMMTASVALGIAVDDTFHYIIWFRRARRRGLSPKEAVYDSFYHCARPMMETTLICGLGMLIFTFTDFLPTQRFALMIALLLAAALVGDLVFLPAILSIPFKRLFAGWRGTRAFRHEAVQPSTLDSEPSIVRTADG